MKLIPLPYETTALTGWTHKAIVTATDVATYDGGGATAVVPIFTTRVGDVVEKAAFRLVTPFHSTTSDMAVELGDGNSAGRFIESTVVDLDGTEILYYAGNAVAIPLAPYAYIVADTIDATFTCTDIGANTAGEIEFVLSVCNLVDLGKVQQPSAT